MTTSTSALLVPDAGVPIPILTKGSDKSVIGRAFQKNLSNPCLSRRHLEIRRSDAAIELLVKGLNPVTIHSTKGRTVLARGASMIVGSGDRVVIVESDPELRFRVVLGCFSVSQVQRWLRASLPERAWEKAARACQQECIDGKALRTLSEFEMEQSLGVQRFGDRRRLTLAIRQLVDTSMDNQSAKYDRRFGTEHDLDCLRRPCVSSICQNRGMFQGNAQHRPSTRRGYATGSAVSEGPLIPSAVAVVRDQKLALQNSRTPAASQNATPAASQNSRPQAAPQDSAQAGGRSCVQTPARTVRVQVPDTLMRHDHKESVEARVRCHAIGIGVGCQLSVKCKSTRKEQPHVVTADIALVTDEAAMVATAVIAGDTTAVMAKEAASVIEVEKPSETHPNPRSGARGKRLRTVTFSPETRLQDGDSAAWLHKRARQLSIEQAAQVDATEPTCEQRQDGAEESARTKRRQKRQQMKQGENVG